MTCGPLTSASGADTHALAVGAEHIGLATRVQMHLHAAPEVRSDMVRRDRQGEAPLVDDPCPRGRRCERSPAHRARPRCRPRWQAGRRGRPRPTSPTASALVVARRVDGRRLLRTLGRHELGGADVDTGAPRRVANDDAALVRPEKDQAALVDAVRREAVVRVCGPGSRRAAPSRPSACFFVGTCTRQSSGPTGDATVATDMTPSSRTPSTSSSSISWVSRSTWTESPVGGSAATASMTSWSSTLSSSSGSMSWQAASSQTVNAARSSSCVPGSRCRSTSPQLARTCVGV